MPTATWKSRLRSGRAHCDLQLAVEVRQCPLGSGARGGGPAVPTGIWTARRRRRVRRRRRRRRTRALLKSSNPHLAGGAKTSNSCPYETPLKPLTPLPLDFPLRRKEVPIETAPLRRLLPSWAPWSNRTRSHLGPGWAH